MLYDDIIIKFSSKKGFIIACESKFNILSTLITPNEISATVEFEVPIDFFLTEDSIKIAVSDYLGEENCDISLTPDYAPHEEKTTIFAKYSWLREFYVFPTEQRMGLASSSLGRYYNISSINCMQNILRNQFCVAQIATKEILK